MGMVGSVRVSTREQDPAAQEWELTAGAERVFVDHGESSRVWLIVLTGGPARTISVPATPWSFGP
jgi:hypothetical protein